MSPTIVLTDGKPCSALGSPGGATIITTVLQMLLNRLDFGMTLPDAIAAPRASQRNSSSTQAEPAFIATWGAALGARGHTFSSDAGDRRSDRNRVPRRRQGGSRGRASPARRRQRARGVAVAVSQATRRITTYPASGKSATSANPADRVLSRHAWSGRGADARVCVALLRRDAARQGELGPNGCVRARPRRGVVRPRPHQLSRRLGADDLAARSDHPRLAK